MKAVIDRFEGDFAVLLVGEEELKVDLPKKLLPKEADEGSWLDFNLELDEDLTEKRREKNRDLLDDLINSSNN